MRTRPNIIL